MEWEKIVIPLPPDSLFRQRDRMRALDFLGTGEDGIPFGNVSMKREEGSFWITGSGTGSVASLQPDQVTLVTFADPEGNFLRCRGPIAASSESLTHAAMYRANPEIGAVVHGHQPRIWRGNPTHLPEIPGNTEYGTGPMAVAAANLIKGRNSGGFLMLGHENGVVFFGRDLAEACALAESTLVSAGQIAPKDSKK